MCRIYLSVRGTFDFVTCACEYRRSCRPSVTSFFRPLKLNEDTSKVDDLAAIYYESQSLEEVYKIVQIAWLVIGVTMLELLLL